MRVSVNIAAPPASLVGRICPLPASSIRCPAAAQRRFAGATANKLHHGQRGAAWCAQGASASQARSTTSAAWPASKSACRRFRTPNALSSKMDIGHQVVARQAFAGAGDRAAVDRHDGAARRGQPDQRRDIAADAGDARHFGHAAPVQLQRHVVGHLGRAGTAGARIHQRQRLVFGRHADISFQAAALPPARCGRSSAPGSNADASSASSVFLTSSPSSVSPSRTSRRLKNRFPGLAGGGRQQQVSSSKSCAAAPMARSGRLNR